MDSDEDLMSINSDCSDHHHEPSSSILEARAESNLIGKERNSKERDESESDDDGERERMSVRTAFTVAENNPNGHPADAEIILSDDDEDSVNSSSERESVALQQNASSAEATSSGYSLRRKRKINYTEMESGVDIDDVDAAVSGTGKSKVKKEVFDVFSFPNSKIARFIRKPELIDHYTKVKIVFLDGTDSEKLGIVIKLFEKCGNQFEDLFIRIRYDVDNYIFLKSVLKTMDSLGRLTYKYHHREDADYILKLLKNLTKANSLQALNSLKLTSICGTQSLGEQHVVLLSKINVQFSSLELGDSLWENVKASSLEGLLLKHKSTLDTLIIHGGFRGDGEKERILITIPEMEVLTKFSICPSYGFVSEIKNPYSKKARMITLDNNREEPYKIAIKFECDLPTLRNLVLGNLIEIEDVLFSTVRRLDEFRCGSYWNLNIRFPVDGSRRTLMESTVTELQFPDALKDPSFPVKIAKYFSKLKKVWMFLPSVPVLRAFFKAFENSNLEELHLKTQFDFESTMESCLLPNMSDVLRKSQATETLVQTLKEYKHFDEYVKYYNVELPVEQEDLMEGHSAGIRALKNLKILRLEHIPRKLLIPIPDDERKWYDHNCKFMSTTFGYERYPLNHRCHKEILQLNLSEYTWKNIQIFQEFTEDFHDAGFVDIPTTYFTELEYQDEEEDLFTPIRNTKASSGTQVKIMPSMLLPNIKAKPESL